MPHTALPATEEFDVIIAGAGPAGLAAALALAGRGWRVAVLDKASEEELADPVFDGREIAMTHHTRHWLEQNSVWEKIDPEAVCPLEKAQVESGREGSLPLIFEDGGPQREGAPLGFLVANHLIRRALYERVQEAREEGASITLLEECSVLSSALSPDGKRRVLETSLGSLLAPLAVAADGRFSPLRSAAGIGATIHDWGTHILVCRMSHEAPHNGVALQWFGEGQTLAFLPVAEKTSDGLYQSSLVLTLSPEEIARLKEVDPESFGQEIEERSFHRFGKLFLESPRITYPLKAVYAHTACGSGPKGARLALLGDALVGMHPITAHGFNYGILAAEKLAAALDGHGTTDPGAPRVLRAYHREIFPKTFPLWAVTNAIASLYTADSRPLMRIREGALSVARNLRPFRRAVSRVLLRD